MKLYYYTDKQTGKPLTQYKGDRVIMWTKKPEYVTIKRWAASMGYFEQDIVVKEINV